MFAHCVLKGSLAKISRQWLDKNRIEEMFTCGIAGSIMRRHCDFIRWCLLFSTRKTFAAAVIRDVLYCE